MCGNGGLFQKSISFLLAGLLGFFLLMPTIGVAASNGESGEKPQPSYLYQLTDDDKQITLTAISKMSPSEVGRLIAELQKQISAEDFAEYINWLTENNITVPTEFMKINMPENVLAKVSKMSEQEKQEYVRRLNGMPDEDINKHMRTTFKQLLPEERAEYLCWLERNGYEQLDLAYELSMETASAQAEANKAEEDDGPLNLADFANMNAQEQQEFMEMLATMSPGDLNAVMSQPAEGLTDAQKSRLAGWVAEHFKPEELDKDNWFAGSTMAMPVETTEADKTEAETTYFAQLTEAEKQQILDAASNMTQEEVGNLIESLRTQVSAGDLQEFAGWLAQHNIAVPAGITTNAGTSETEEDNGPLNLADFANMNVQEQQEFMEMLATMSPGDINAVMSQPAEGLTDAQKSRLAGWVAEHFKPEELDKDNWFAGSTMAVPVETTEADKTEAETTYFAQLTEAEKQQILDAASNMTQEEVGNLIESLRTQVSAGDLQEFAGWLAQHNIAVSADIAATAETGEEEITSISQLSDAEKSELLDMLSRMTAEQFNAYIAVLRVQLTAEAMNEFIDWLAAAYHLDPACRTFSITLPTTFKVYGSLPWPGNVSLPEQGFISQYSQGSEAIEIQIQNIAGPTYEVWKNAILESECWEEMNDSGKKTIEKAVKDNFGPWGLTPEEHFAESGIEMADIVYFTAVTGGGCGYAAFGANNAILFVSQK